MNAMASISAIIAPFQNKLKYLIFSTEVGNILPLKKTIQPRLAWLAGELAWQAGWRKHPGETNLDAS